MSTQVVFHAANQKPSVTNFLMARRPILDRQQDMAAFELLFADALAGASQAGDDTALVSSLLPHFVELQMERVLGDLRGFVNVDEGVILSDVFQRLPRTRFVLNIPETVKATDAVLARLGQLASAGFVFALDEVLSNREDVQKFLPLAEIVTFDLRKLSLEELVELTPQVKFANKKLYVQNVETLAQFETCLSLGFDYFQGYHFARPLIEADKKLAPSQLAIIEVMTLISTDADDADIEERVKSDVSLGLHLLRLVNTAAVGNHRIDSLRQALIVMGRDQLLRWLQILLYTEPHENIASIKPLLMLATTRGKLLELLASRTRVGNRAAADTAFTVGIMSLMDTLFSMAMPDILDHIAVSDEVRQALLERKGYFGELLQVAEFTERVESLALLSSELQKRHLSTDDLYLLQTEAFEWSNNVMRAMHDHA